MKVHQLTVRNVPDEVAQRLKDISRERGESLNSTVLRLLSDSVGYNSRAERLKRYTTWTKEEADEFDKFLREQRQIDKELWQ